MKTHVFSPENSLNKLPPLPLLQLTGGTDEFRDQFMRRLITALHNHSLACRHLGKADTFTRFSLLSLIRQYDLVIADAGLELPLETVKIYCEAGSGASEFCWCGGDGSRFDKFVDKLIQMLDGLASRMPVWGCVLIGGKSSRMGCPKHLLRNTSGSTWLEHAFEVLSPMLDGMAISGHGLVPDRLKSCIRLPDVPGVAGPLAGLLAASRWLPMVGWLLVACDMPHITEEAVEWLLAARHSGCWGIVPRQAGMQHCEPLFAWYDFRAAQLVEEQIFADNFRIGMVASHPKIDTPVIPERLRYAWKNINTPEQLGSIS